jgi:hypothetical protein
MHRRTLHRYSFVMPIRVETSDRTIYCAMFGQCDPHNRPWCSVERALGMARQAGIEKNWLQDCFITDLEAAEVVLWLRSLV